MFKQKILFLASLLIFVGGLNAQAQDYTTQRIYLSGTDKDHTVSWKFYITAGRNSGKWTTIAVPSNWELQGFGNYTYGGGDYIKQPPRVKGLYKYKFSVPAGWKDKAVYIVFEGSMTDTKVKINGKLAGPVHRGGFYQFEYNISDLLNYGANNLLEVTVHKVSSNQSVNAAELTADYWIFGGIYRPVYLVAKPRPHIKRIAIDAKANGEFTAHVFIEGEGKAASVSAHIETPDGKKVGKVFKTTINDNQKRYQRLSAKLSHIKPWSPEFPHLYFVEFYLKDSQGHIIHKVKQRFGFRTFQLRADGFYLNGQKIRFRGVNYHAFWPESGRTLSKERVIKDIKLMKGMNINAVRLSHYPRVPYFYNVADSLGILVMDELAGWQDEYHTDVGRKLVKEMVTRNVNHPSIVMWNSGNEGGYNFELDKYYWKWDPQNRPVNHPGDIFRGITGNIFRGIDSQHYIGYHGMVGKFTHENKVYFPDEMLHGLFAGGAGAGLEDYWNLMQSQPLSAGGFIWVFADGCVERTDKNGRLDCNNNSAPDGIVGPYRGKSGSFYAVKEIWAPVQIQKKQIFPYWDKKLRVRNRFYFTNLNQVTFNWKLVDYPSPFDKPKKVGTISRGPAASPDVAPQTSGFLQFDLPDNWTHADALKLTATGPNEQQIYTWVLPIRNQQDWASSVIENKDSSTADITQTPESYLLTSGDLRVTISKETGYITRIQKNGTSYSLAGGPFLAGDGSSESLKSIQKDDRTITVTFTKADYTVTYSLVDDWLKIDYSYRPVGTYPYFGISFNYPQTKVNGITWLGDGPTRVWKNRMPGAELGLWHRKHIKDPKKIAIHGYHWNFPKFAGYYSNLHWAVLKTTEGPITMMTSQPHIFLGLLKPDYPPKPRNATAKYPNGNLSFLNAISPIGSKFHEPPYFGPSSQPNLYTYGYTTQGHAFEYKGTLWFYFGKRK